MMIITAARERATAIDPEMHYVPSGADVALLDL